MVRRGKANDLHGWKDEESTETGGSEHGCFLGSGGRDAVLEVLWGTQSEMLPVWKDSRLDAGKGRKLQPESCLHMSHLELYG